MTNISSNSYLADGSTPINKVYAGTTQVYQWSGINPASNGFFYGLRKMVNNYAGPIIRLRRESDNAEQDFFADATDINGGLDYADIDAWRGGTPARVVRVYDQGKFGRHQQQLTAINQPTLDTAAQEIQTIASQGMAPETTSPTLLSGSTELYFTILGRSRSNENSSWGGVSLDPTPNQIAIFNGGSTGEPGNNGENSIVLRETLAWHPFSSAPSSSNLVTRSVVYDGFNAFGSFQYDGVDQGSLGTYSTQIAGGIRSPILLTPGGRSGDTSIKEMAVFANPILDNSFENNRYRCNIFWNLAPILDYAPFKASASYSLRKLRLNYTGSCIRVRRSSDNAEQDIGFNINRELDTASLLSFVGAGSGFVVTWFDQSGNGRHASQSTLNRQPVIVNGGTLLQTINGKPKIEFVNTYQLDASGITYGPGASIYFTTDGLSTPVVNQYHNVYSTDNPTTPALWSCRYYNNGVSTDAEMYRDGFVNNVNGAVNKPSVHVGGRTALGAFHADNINNEFDLNTYNDLGATQQSISPYTTDGSYTGQLFIGYRTGGTPQGTLNGGLSELILFEGTTLRSTQFNTDYINNTRTYYGVI